MTIKISWIDQSLEMGEPIKIATDIAVLEIYQVDEVITQTKWLLGTVDAQVLGNKHWNEIKQYLNNPTNDLTVKLHKQGSDFRNKVWAEICKIPIGEVMSYSQLAEKVDSGARAVANACRDNLYPGIIPCHRVVAVSGLGGFMGKTDGPLVDLKKDLLAFEQRCVQF